MTIHNPLLCPADSIMNYAAVAPEHIVPAITTLINEHRNLVDHICAQPPTLDWTQLVQTLAVGGSRLWRAWHVINHLNAVVNAPELRNAYNEVLPLVTEYSTQLGLNRQLFAHYQALHDSPTLHTLSPERQRIIRLALRDFKLSGVQLEGQAQQRYAQISEAQAKTAQQFSENALDSVDQWVHYEEDLSALAGLPQDCIEAARTAAQAAGKSGYQFTLKMPSYLPVMQYAKNATLRETLYRGYTTIASDQGDPRFDNSQAIETLLALRYEEAQLLGFQHYAEQQLQTRMADSPEQVMRFLHDLATKAKPFALRDREQLLDFAKTQLGMETLQPWDYAYVSEQLRQHQYAYSDEDVKQYLSEPNVMSGFFALIERLFHVQFNEVSLPTWHPDVRSYEVRHDDQLIGHLYTDLYARAGKQSGAWVGVERSRHAYDDTLLTPIIYLTCNFTPPTSDKPALLTHDDLITLFHESGHALHGLLSTVSDPEASPFSSVEWDAIELPSQFMENFAWEWDVLQQLSSHWQTGEPLPRELYDKMLAAKHFQSGMQTVRQLEFALFDMQIHQSPPLSIAQVQAHLDAVRQAVAVIIPPSWNRFAHNFSHLFAGGYAAGYYSYKWAEVLSSDAYAKFEENRLPNGSTINPEIGRQFRDHILAVGGSKPAAEFFRNFRERDPQPEAMLRHQGLIAEVNHG